MNLVEHVGSGIGRMKDLMLSEGLSEPQYETEGMFNITLFRKGASGSDNGLSDLEKLVLELMSSDIKPTIEQLCKKLERKKSTIYNILKSLKVKGYSL